MGEGPRPSVTYQLLRQYSTLYSRLVPLLILSSENIDRHRLTLLRQGTHLRPAHEAREGGIAVGDGHDAGRVGGDEGRAGQREAAQLPGAHGCYYNSMRA